MHTPLTSTYIYAEPESKFVAECSYNKFRCSNGECIWRAWVCDSDSDCPDGGDEDNTLCADTKNCNHEQYKCETSGECIDYHLVCNGHNDCVDASDERGCDDPAWNKADKCGPNHYTCDSGDTCHEASTICDGHYDCIDGSDELSCGHGNMGDNDGHRVRVAGVIAEREDINNTAIRIHWWIPDIAKMTGLKYQPAYSVVGKFQLHCYEDQNPTN